jgi:hypothetical protein
MLAGIDLVGCKAAFAHAFPKLVRGSAPQSLAGFQLATKDRLDDRQFPSVVLSAPGDRFSAVGLGDELRFDTSEIGGWRTRVRGSPRPSFRLPQA